MSTTEQLKVGTRATAWLVGGATLVLFTLFVSGVLILSATGSTAGGTLASGRSVMTESDGWTLSSVFSADSATIETAGHTIVVHPNCLVVDGRKVANIHESVAEVRVHVNDGTIGFEADGYIVQCSTE